jgi:prefoldin subunit 5
MISQATILANDGLDLIMEQQKQQSTSYGIDSIEPKCQELEEMKKKLTEQIDEKRQNLKLLRTYVDKLESVKPKKSGLFFQINF